MFVAHWSSFSYSDSFWVNIYSALCCLHGGGLISERTSPLHTSAALCLSSPAEGTSAVDEIQPQLLTFGGSAFVSSPVTTNNSWIAVNVSAAVSPPRPPPAPQCCTQPALTGQFHEGSIISLYAGFDHARFLPVKNLEQHWNVSAWLFKSSFLQKIFNFYKKKIHLDLRGRLFRCEALNVLWPI